MRGSQERWPRTKKLKKRHSRNPLKFENRNFETGDQRIEVMHIQVATYLHTSCI